jgi:hypothetical protein
MAVAVVKGIRSLAMPGLRVPAAAHADRLVCSLCHCAGVAVPAAAQLTPGMSHVLHGLSASHVLPALLLNFTPLHRVAVSISAASDFSCLAPRMLPSQPQHQSPRLRSISFHIPV